MTSAAAPEGTGKRASPACIEWICLALGAFLAIWYGWIVDDAYIYFRYVDNLVIHKIGLVYNPGEFVEGFSSPAWAMMLIVLRFFHVNYWFLIRAVGVAAYALFWLLAVKVNGRLSARHAGAVNFPLAYLTCAYGVMCYFTSGLETPLVLVSSAACAALLLFPENGWLQVLVGVSPLIRPELSLPCFMLLIWILIRKKRFPVFLALTLALAGGGYELFRVWRYADLAPNTFYLKDEIWIAQGLSYLYDTCLAYQTVPVMGMLAVLYAALRKRHGPAPLHEEERLMMLAAALPVLLYVIKIGGDPRHFRYLAFPFCLAILSAGGLVEVALGRIVRENRHAVNAMGVGAMVLFLSNFPRELQQPPLFRASWGFSHAPFLRINDPAMHRFHESGITPPLETLFPQALSYSEASARYHRQKPDIIEEAWCQTGYLQPQSFVLHSLGLTDPVLARTRMKSTLPGHRWGLAPLAEQLLAVRKIYGFRRGAFSRAIGDGVAPAWMVKNIASLEWIEAKAYNDHSLWKNLRLAFRRIKPIEP